jgi:hypothetical protein
MATAATLPGALTTHRHERGLLRGRRGGGGSRGTSGRTAVRVTAMGAKYK